ncbi:alpha/beta fold hydrolase [Phreatobacter cathodiphilus]|uniref:Alpha/beta hydrolase n=1 Tax=Phreatobacter cathodiphilus TaxID=1868589 RepID=A0A2S0ND76_9HYPH|nr:alpha/beta fold hydrolase [Phreatobacter cathodiphilus]AVO46134.1 alpha/beta hydrolase [Phreatobacter cathodiphilus]
MAMSIGIAVLLVLVIAALGYRRDMARATARLAEAVVAATRAGPVVYRETGTGLPVLALHGSGGGFDQGLAMAGALLGDGYRIIAPSRPGYPGTPLPVTAETASEVELHAALLDHLDIRRAVVIGASAGARSALDFALIHPERVAALILAVPATAAPGDPVRIEPSLASSLAFAVVKAGADPLWWAGLMLAPRLVLRFLGVSPAAYRGAPPEERRRALALARGVMPLRARVDGIRRDSRPDRATRPLETLRCPTLVVTAADDLFNTLPAARHLAATIPGARLVVHPSGGHLLLGCSQDAVRAFLSEAGQPPGG